MSYIINNTSAFVNIKLTETGRQKLAQGQLNFTSWGIGDSEINYDREEIYDLPTSTTDVSLSGSSRILRPVDRQPDIKSYITANSNNNNNLNLLNSSQISTIKAIVNNEAKDRGFFSGDGTTHITYTSSTYSQGTSTVVALSGGKTLVIGTGATFNIGDYILLKVGNDTVGSLSLNQNTTPVPNLWYKIEQITGVGASKSAILDRELPSNGASSATSQILIYPGGEVYSAFGFETTTPYWNSNTLDFAGCCDVSCGDVPIWNQNAVWCENLAGMTGTSVYSGIAATPNESFEKFGSNDYLGQKYPYFEVDCVGDKIGNDICANPGESVIDDAKKSISILHYTNNTISNYYGEFFFIDGASNKTLSLQLPDLMYHRRDYSTESGTTMGMKFIATGVTKFVGTSDLEYVDLIEDPSLVSGTEKVVGRVFPQLKTVIFEDDEIIAATSYKSNRNWTLPALKAKLSAPSGGITAGVLATNKTMYITYTFENTSGVGLTTTLPSQYYAKIENNTSSTKDIEFNIENIDLLPYMRKEEKSGYDGMGFSAKEFKVLYQIVENSDDRPLSNAWKVHNFTSTAITTVANQTIDPKLLEIQNPTTNGFLIDATVSGSSTTFSIIDSLEMATNSSPEKLQFGDERFFYGNLETYIGATIFKTVFNINLSADDFKTTENPSRPNSLANPPDIRVTEIGIYDDDNSLVMIGKLSKPVKLSSGNTVMLELSIDF